MKFWFQILEILKKFQIHGDKKNWKILISKLKYWKLNDTDNQANIYLFEISAIFSIEKALY